MKYFDLLKPNIDKFGVITQSAADSWDGGDTIQREGMYLCAMWYHLQAGRVSQQDWLDAVNRYDYIIKQLNVSNGWSLRRHPDSSMWYYEPNCMSRDQLTSNLAALGYGNQDVLLQLLLKHMIRAMFFTTNTRNNGAYPGTPAYAWKLPDITFSSIWGAYIRGLNWKLLWPLLPLFDLELVVDSCIILYKVKQDPTFCDHLSQQMLLLQSQERMPTWISRLAMWIYKKAGPQQALDQYFTVAKCAPAMNEVYREIWASK